MVGSPNDELGFKLFGSAVNEFDRWEVSQGDGREVSFATYGGEACQTWEEAPFFVEASASR